MGSVTKGGPEPSSEPRSCQPGSGLRGILEGTRGSIPSMDEVTTAAGHGNGKSHRLLLLVLAVRWCNAATMGSGLHTLASGVRRRRRSGERITIVCVKCEEGAEVNGRQRVHPSPLHHPKPPGLCSLSQPTSKSIPSYFGASGSAYPHFSLIKTPYGIL